MMWVKYDKNLDKYFKKLSATGGITQIPLGQIPPAWRIQITAVTPKWVKLPNGFWNINPDPSWAKMSVRPAN